ncbi:MAG: hypothetical protein QM770_07200 [Tepidisphaeraceae bacterium]
MSYPAGYPQPNPYGYTPIGYNPNHQSVDQLKSPAKWAGLTMIILGVLGILMGGCLGAMMSMAATPEVARAMEQQARSVPGGTVEMMRMIFVIFAIALAVWGLIAIALGMWCRFNHRVGMILTIIYCVLSLGYIALNLIVTIVGGSAQPGGLVAAGCVVGLPSVLLMLVIGLLTKGLVNVSKIRNAEAQWAAWQQQYAAAYYAQQQQPPPPPAGG